MDVRHVYPAADVQGADTQLFGIDTLPLYVSLEIIRGMGESEKRRQVSCLERGEQK